MSSSLPPLAVIAGPTASGKSAYALARARDARGVIINADASQCYADLQILSARPSEAEMEGVPHRLYGFADAATPLNAADWVTRAKLAIDAAHGRGELPILVGGTGMYLRILLDGIAPVPEIDADVRQSVRALTQSELAAALANEDPAMAARLNPNDQQRIARALEVKRSSGRSLVDFHAVREGGIGGKVTLDPLVLDIDRDTLTGRCATRFDQMIATGALQEVRRLAARKLSPDLPAMKAIGVPPLLAHLRGDVSLASAIARAKIDTRQYAKRQRTWFNNQTPDWPRAAVS